MKPPFPSEAAVCGRSEAMVPSSEKKWRPSAVRAGLAGAPASWTVSVAVFESRVATIFHEGSNAGSCERTARILEPQTGSGWGFSAETGRSSLSFALPGTHSSWHMSHSAAAWRLTAAPAFRSAGGVRVTGSRRSPS